MKKIQGEPVPVIETRGLRLRGFTNDDLDALAEIFADPDVMRYMPGGTPVPRERVAASLGRMMGYWQSCAATWRCGNRRPTWSRVSRRPERWRPARPARWLTCWTPTRPTTAR